MKRGSDKKIVVVSVLQLKNMNFDSGPFERGDGGEGVPGEPGGLGGVGARSADGRGGGEVA